MWSSVTGFFLLACVSEVHACYNLYHCIIPFYCQIIFHCRYIHTLSVYRLVDIWIVSTSLATVNDAAMNIYCKILYENTFIFFLGIHLVLELLNNMVVFCLIFVFSQVVYSDPNYSTSSLTFVIVCLFYL